MSYLYGRDEAVAVEAVAAAMSGKTTLIYSATVEKSKKMAELVRQVAGGLPVDLGLITFESTDRDLGDQP